MFGVLTGMNIIESLHAEIEEVSKRRSELWDQLSDGRNSDTVKQIRELEAKLATLWDEHRTLRARIRFGEREQIVKRARAQERLDRVA